MLSLLYAGDLFGQQKFYAYHTKVIHSSTDYFGKYADLIVVLGEGRQLEFTRRTQYLPRWVTPQGSFLVDDFFPGRDPDYEFNYNYVRLMEASEERIVVHWRYIPNIETINKANAALDPTFMEGFTSAVHEMFTIHPSGLVEREVRDARGSSYESWVNPEYGDKQKLQLNEDGIVHGSVTWGNKSIALPIPVAKNPIISSMPLPDPVLWWTFDEGGGDYPQSLAEDIEEMLEYEPGAVIGKTVEYVNKAFHPVKGHGAVYKKGVSGTSLAFDGYYTGVTVPKISTEPGTTYFRENQVAEFKDAMTVEAWIALDAYPYNVAPIVHQSKNFGEEGFYLGVNPYGHLTYRVNGQVVTSPNAIELYRWTHVAGIFGDGKLELYVDGEKVAADEASGNISQPNTTLMIGLNTDKERCTDYVRRPNAKHSFHLWDPGLVG